MKSVAIAVVLVLVASSLLCAAGGLSVRWDFDEGKGDVVKEAGGAGLEGKIVLAQWAKGVGGKDGDFSLSFTDYSQEPVKPDPSKATSVSIPHAETLVPSKTVSVSAAVFIDPEFFPYYYAGIVEKGKGYGCSYRLLLVPTSRGKAWAEKKEHAWVVRAAVGNGHATVDSKTEIKAGKWVRLSMEYDGAVLRVLIDGKEEGRKEVEVKGWANRDPIVIGYRLSGKIDEVAIKLE